MITGSETEIHSHDCHSAALLVREAPVTVHSCIIMTVFGENDGWREIHIVLSSTSGKSADVQFKVMVTFLYFIILVIGIVFLPE